MTIKELEEHTGIPRANIRYYESEGLLSPVRMPNGYRDYAQADVETLEKIRLLRQLHMDLDTIKAVQRGDLPLERALFLQLTKLEGDQAAAQRAAAVCRELEASGVEYGALEGAEKEGWPLNHRELAGQIAECWGDFETELCGIHVTQRVTHSGYDGLGQILVAIDGEVQHYERVVTITLTGDA